MNIRQCAQRSVFAFALLAAGFWVAPRANAQSHVHLGVRIYAPGVAAGVANCWRCGYWVGGPAYYLPAYSAPAYYPAPGYYAAGPAYYVPTPIYYGYNRGYLPPSYYPLRYYPRHDYRHGYHRHGRSRHHGRHR